MKKGPGIFSGCILVLLVIIMAVPLIVGMRIKSQLPNIESLLKAYPQVKITNYQRHWFSSDLTASFHGHTIKEHIFHGPVIFHSFQHKSGPQFALALGTIKVDSAHLKAEAQSLLNFNQKIHTVSTLQHFSLPNEPFNIKVSNAKVNLVSNLKTAKTTGTITVKATAQLDAKHHVVQAVLNKNLASGASTLKLSVSKPTLEFWLAKKNKNPDAVLSTLEKIKYLHPSKDGKSYTVEINMQNGKVI